MVITQAIVQQIAHLARIAVTPEEQAAYGQSLEKIFTIVEQLNAADTHDVQPMIHPLQAIQRLREDEVTETDQSEMLQRTAPFPTVEKLYLVPPVIE